MFLSQIWKLRFKDVKEFVLSLHISLSGRNRSKTHVWYQSLALTTMLF